jgi:hypothetical protein
MTLRIYLLLGHLSASAALIEPYLGEPDKRRMVATLKGEKTDRVPNFEVLIENQHVTKLLSRYVGNTILLIISVVLMSAGDYLTATW